MAGFPRACSEAARQAGEQALETQTKGQEEHKRVSEALKMNVF